MKWCKFALVLILLAVAILPATTGQAQTNTEMEYSQEAFTCFPGSQNLCRRFINSTYWPSGESRYINLEPVTVHTEILIIISGELNKDGPHQIATNEMIYLFLEYAPGGFTGNSVQVQYEDIAHFDEIKRAMIYFLALTNEAGQTTRMYVNFVNLPTTDLKSLPAKSSFLINPRNADGFEAQMERLYLQHIAGNTQP